MKLKLIITIVFAASLSAFAQLPSGNLTSTNKKAIDLYKSALLSYDHFNDKKALENARKAIGKDSSFIEPYLLIANVYASQKRIDDAILMYKRAIQVNPRFSKTPYFVLGTLEFSRGNYKDALHHLEEYLLFSNINPNNADVAHKLVANCKFAIEAIKTPVPFKPVNMGPAINSPVNEYFPAVTADGKTFLYTRNNRTNTTHAQEDFLISEKGPNGNWKKARLIGNGINTEGNEGAPSLSADGQLLIFAACQENQSGSFGGQRKGIGSCDLFYTQKVGDRWTKVYNLGHTINTKMFESQPSFSADGKTLYFVSNRPGGVGKGDIYVSTLDEKGYWTEPRNIGTKVNTTEKEESVFIHPDGKTLYFSSNGHVGMGGLDIYVTRKGEDGKWSTPVNLGYPINTYGDENSLLVAASGDIAYFASSRKGGYGGLDMYHFELYDAVRPGKISYVKGKVYNANNKVPLSARFELIDLKTQKRAILSTSDKLTGEFLVTLPVGTSYALNVSKKGYLFYSEHYSLNELKDGVEPYFMDVPLQPIDTGNVVELKNVFFQTGKFDLKPTSKTELNKLVAFLKLNKTLKIELSGHTDNVGAKQMNQILSKNRAKAVFDYLVAGGIDPLRLTYKGYGDSKPKVSNDTDAKRAMNRRTEFKVVGL